MHIRRSTHADLPIHTTIQAHNNAYDALGRHFTRNLFKHWTSYRLGCWTWLRSLHSGRGTQCFVAVTNASDYPDLPAHEAENKAGEVVGWIYFVRYGSSDDAKQWQGSTYAGPFWTVERALLRCEKWYYDTFTGAQPTFNHVNFAKIGEVINEQWDKEIFAEAWEVEGLSVDKDWQRKGIGRMLVEWGFERAREEGVPVLVKSSPIGTPAYKKMGFRSIGDAGFGEFFDELEFGGETHQILVWEPEGSQGRWYERGKEEREERMRRIKEEKLRKKEEGVGK